MNAVFCMMLLIGVAAAAAQGRLSAAQDSLLGGGAEAVALRRSRRNVVNTFLGAMGAAACNAEIKRGFKPFYQETV